MNIVVLCGGLCAERDVSIVSGRQIAGALIEREHRVLLLDLFLGYSETFTDPLDLFSGTLPATEQSVASCAPDLAAVAAMRGGAAASRIGPAVLELCKAADIVFLALHGEDGENGRLQALFDLLQIRYTGTGYLGSALAMHKGIARDLLAQHGICVAPGHVIRHGDMTGDVRYPCVVKPCSGGSSVATAIVHQASQLQVALDAAFTEDAEILIEDYIPGREFSVGVLGDSALPVIEICPKNGFFDYENKYQADLTDEICPADLPADTAKKMQAIALAVHKTLHLAVYSRSDFILSKSGTIYCLEANTLPGMTPTSLLPQEAAAVGVDFGALCDMIIELSLTKYRSC